MNDIRPTRPDDHDGARLWAAVAPPDAPAGSCPDAMILASFAEGTIDGAARPAVEAHLAACPICLDLVVGATAEEPVLVDRRVRARAQGLVPSVVIAGHRFTWPTFGRWSVAAAASIAVCLFAFHAGARSVQAMAPSVEAAIVDDITFGTFDEEEAEWLALAPVAVDDGEASK